MSLKEKIAYLKGFAEGLGFEPESKEGKLIPVIIDTLVAITGEIDALNENALDIGEELDAISDDLADVEELLFDDDYDDDDDDDDDYIFGDFDDDDDDDDDDECDCPFCSGEDFSVQIECPNCSADIDLNETDISNGSATCASCGEEIELDFEDDDDDDDDEDEGP